MLSFQMRSVSTLVSMLSMLALAAAQSSRVLSIVDFGALSDASVSGRHEQVIFEEFHEKNSPLLSASRSEPWWRSMEPGLRNVTEVSKTNTRAFNAALLAAKPGDTVLVPAGESFAFTGGIVGSYLDRVTIDIAGSMHFIHDQDVWPRYSSKVKKYSGDHWGFLPGLNLIDSTNVKITCSGPDRPTVTVDFAKNEVFMNQGSGSAGVINGEGKLWWDEAILGRLPYKDPDFRPRLMLVEGCVDVVVENLTLLNSPFWTLTVEGLRIEVAHVYVLVDRQYQTTLLGSTLVAATSRRNLRLSSWIPNDIPDWVGRKIHQPEDLNTDGIDPRGVDIRVHNCIVQNADDSVAVKPPIYGNRTTALNGTIPIPCTRNVTIEDTVLTGFGASIGSVGPSRTNPCVDRVLFRNITMPGTGKGIYVKSNKSRCRHGVSSQITNIVYDTIYLKEPFWWAVWIGPQQQHEPQTDLDGDCPLAYPLPGSSRCPTQGCTTFENITLRNVRIQDPFISPGVIMGNATNPMKNIVMEDITVSYNTWKPWHGKLPFHEAKYPFHGTFQCKHAALVCKNCFPEPYCD